MANTNSNNDYGYGELPDYTVMALEDHFSRITISLHSARVSDSEIMGVFVCKSYSGGMTAQENVGVSE